MAARPLSALGYALAWHPAVASAIEVIYFEATGPR
jgi:hypothetical protein